jgi:hypothetical protein
VVTRLRPDLVDRDPVGRDGAAQRRDQPVAELIELEQPGDVADQLRQRRLLTGEDPPAGVPTNDEVKTYKAFPGEPDGGQWLPAGGPLYALGLLGSPLPTGMARPLRRRPRPN